MFVSVLLVKGRTSAASPAVAATRVRRDASDPGKPAFRLGYVELKVEDARKRLTVTVSADQQEYRPGERRPTCALDVKDSAGRGVASEVTLWAVDYGVLSLTGVPHAGRARFGLRREGAAGDERPTTASASSAAAC